MTGDDWDSHVGAKYDPETDTYHARYQRDEPGTLAGAIVYLVSVATGKKPETMEPLHESVDADALENLFQSREEQIGQVEFRYYGCEVTASSDGEVVVTPPEDDE